MSVQTSIFQAQTNIPDRETFRLYSHNLGRIPRRSVKSASLYRPLLLTLDVYPKKAGRPAFFEYTSRSKRDRFKQRFKRGSTSNKYFRVLRQSQDVVCFKFFLHEAHFERIFKTRTPFSFYFVHYLAVDKDSFPI